MSDGFLNKERLVIAQDMLYRYTGCGRKDIEKYILLTNFAKYLDSFCKLDDVVLHDKAVFRVATSRKLKISMIQFNIGAPTAALLVDLLGSVHPKSVLMLGLCGGLHRSLKIGEFVVPMAAIRNEGVSEHYMPASVPSLPTFKVQHILSNTMTGMKVPYKTGVVHSTDFRFWEFHNEFRERLKKEKALAIEMECSALFIAAFKVKVPIGALLLVSDLPMTPGGVKTAVLQEHVYKNHLQKHIDIGVATLQELQKVGREIDLRHFQW